MRRNSVSVFGSVVVLLAAFATARATVVTVPTSLSPGDSYYLAFVTNLTTAASSSDIAFYDAFVQAQANAAGLNTIAGNPVTWKALVSTTTTNAVTHLGIGSSPVFRLNDTQIASGGSDLWDGSIAVPLNVTESGTTLPAGSVWTGSQANGVAYPAFQVGTANPISGGLNSASSSWLVANSNQPNTTLFRIYAFSQELQVVPEPSAVVLALSGAAAVIGLTLAKRRARNSR